MSSLSNKDIIKYCDITSKGRVKCKCGHTVIMPPHQDKKLCYWCNSFVFRNKKAEFEYRMKESMHKQNLNK